MVLGQPGLITHQLFSSNCLGNTVLLSSYFEGSRVYPDIITEFLLNGFYEINTLSFKPPILN